MSYTLKDANRLARQIVAEFPGAHIERYRDHGWAIDVFYRGRELIACQPPRSDHQPEIFRSIDDIKAIFDRVTVQ